MSDEAALPRPNGICPECQHSAPVMQHDPSGRIALYCEHNQAGAMRAPSSDGAALWIIWTPIDADEFAGSILKFAERWRMAFGAAGDAQH